MPSRKADTDTQSLRNWRPCGYVTTRRGCPWKPAMKSGKNVELNMRNIVQKWIFPSRSSRSRSSEQRGRRSSQYADAVTGSEWPEPVERVSAYLRAAGVEARLEEFEAGTPTAEAAAEAVGCEPGRIVKSLVFDRVPAPADPWGSKSIEWQLPSPVPVHNFDRIPVFSSDPYGYGEPSAPVAAPVGAPAGRD